MLTAKQARTGSYDRTVFWCETKLQPEIVIARLQQRNQAHKLFTEDEVNPKELKKMLEQMGYNVVLTNMTEQSGFKSSFGAIYNVTVEW